jgi:hypothetical protein
VRGASRDGLSERYFSPNHQTSKPTNHYQKNEGESENINQIAMKLQIKLAEKVGHIHLINKAKKLELLQSDSLLTEEN